MTLEISAAARVELAPGGKLRVGINHSNFLIVTPGSPFGAPKGIAPDIALELGRRAGVPVEFVSFDAAGKLADAVKGADVDVGFLGNEPQRADVIAFSPAYVELPVTYLVPAGASPCRRAAPTPSTSAATGSTRSSSAPRAFPPRWRCSRRSSSRRLPGSSPA